MTWIEEPALLPPAAGVEGAGVLPPVVLEPPPAEGVAAQFKMGVKPLIPSAACPTWVVLQVGVAPDVQEEAAPPAVKAVVAQWQTQALTAGFWTEADKPGTLMEVERKLALSAVKSAAGKVLHVVSWSKEAKTQVVQGLLSND